MARPFRRVLAATALAAAMLTTTAPPAAAALPRQRVCIDGQEFVIVIQGVPVVIVIGRECIPVL